jgi:cation transport ATPase
VTYAEESNLNEMRDTVSSTATSFLPIEDGSFAAISGKGISCTIDGHSVAVGSPSFVQAHTTFYDEARSRYVDKHA